MNSLRAIEIGSLAFTIALFALAVRRWLFKRAKKNVPTAEQVWHAMSEMGEDVENEIKHLRARYAPLLPFDTFAALCFSVTLTLAQKTSCLAKGVILAEHLDSLNHVYFIMLIEELTKLEIPDQDAENILTFDRLAEYVQSRLREA